MKKLIIPFFTLVNLSVIAQTNINIIPKPVELNQRDGYFSLTKSTVIVANSAAKHNADMLNFYLKKFYGFKLSIKNISPSQNVKNVIILLSGFHPGDRKKDQYELSISSNKINIGGTSNAGLFYGIQTLLQLLPTDKDSINNSQFQIPLLTIKDYPRFQYRGMHLDVGRHFFGVDEVKKYIDYLAFHKFNTFHWHLTEDQGWRIEIKRYPLLTSVGGFRNGTIIGHHPGTGNDSIHYGGFYTQQEIKDVVKYAQDRYITIIPEIEIAGAFLRSYRCLSKIELLSR